MRVSYCENVLIFLVVLRGTIISDRNETKKETELTRALGIPPLTYVHYDALVSRVYKGFKKMTKVIGLKDSFLFRIPIHISQSGALCGFELKKNTKYLIMGKIVAKQMQVTHCSFIQELHQVSHEVRRGINGKYNCDCNVQLCFDGFCERHGKECKWHMQWGSPVDECTLRHKTCQPVENSEEDESNKKNKKNSHQTNNKCQWREDTKPYDACMKNKKYASALK